MQSDAMRRCRPCELAHARQAPPQTRTHTHTHVTSSRAHLHTRASHVLVGFDLCRPAAGAFRTGALLLCSAHPFTMTQHTLGYTFIRSDRARASCKRAFKSKHLAFVRARALVRVIQFYATRERTDEAQAVCGAADRIVISYIRMYSFICVCARPM